MSRTITLTNVRTTSDITTRLRLKDGGVYVDWTGLTDIKAWLYSDAQKAIAGRFTVAVDQEDSTRLLCDYSAQKPQYLGVNRIIVQAKYLGRTKTYDKPYLNLVARTADVSGTPVVLEDPVVDVEIEVTDVSSSILDDAIAAALAAAEKAEEAAGHTPYIGENGDWFEWSEEAGAFVDTGVSAGGGGGGNPNAVLYVEQSLTSGQQSQARTNIGAGTFSKPGSGIPKTDLESSVQTSLGKADTAVQSVPGKGLSENDYTDAEKDKVALLSSDSAVVDARLADTLVGQPDSIVLQVKRKSGSTTTINYFDLASYYVQKEQGKGLFSGSYNDLTDKPTIPDVTGKADKVTGATSGNFASLDGNGNLTDSGSKASDFATAAQGAKADTAIQPSQTAGLLKNDGTVDTTAYGTYSKPSGGIPSSDMTSAVQTSLGKADTAYQKPSGGIPGTDLATGVIPTVPTISTDISTDGNDDTKTASPKAVKTYADTKYTKPQNGIPASDMEAGAIPTVPTISTNVATDKASDTKTSSPKSVYDEVHPAVASSQPAGGFAPNVVYDLGTLTGTVTFALAAVTDATIANAYHWTFDTGSTAPTITWPSGIVWPDGFTPSVDASKHYEVLVRNGYASMLSYSLS